MKSQSAPKVGETRPGRAFRWKLIEVNGNGHRLWYLSLLLQRVSLMDLPGRVQLITRPDVMDLAAWSEHIQPWEDVLDLDCFGSQQSRSAILCEAARERSAIVIPDGDMWLPLLFSVRFMSRRSLHGSILLMRPKPEADWSSKWRHLVKSMLRLGVRLMHPNLRVFDLVAVGGPGHPAEVLDPVEFLPADVTRDDWLNRNNLDPAFKWLAVLGEISQRKCVDTVAEALSSQRALEAGWRLIIVGNTADEPLVGRLAALSAAHPGQIICRRTFMTNVEFDTWVANADAVSILYRNEGSSGVLLKCWAAGTPVIVGGSHAVVNASKILAMNYVPVDDLSSEAVLTALTGSPPLLRERNFSGPDWQIRSEDFARRLLWA